MKKFNNLKSWMPAFSLAAFLFAACSQTETLEDITQNSQDAAPTAVQFGTYLNGGKESRAGHVGDIITTQLQQSKDQGGGFGVFAYFTGSTDWSSSSEPTPNFMYNQLVTYNSTDNKWTYSPIKYWPNGNATADNQQATGEDGGKVSFFAYAPYVDVTQNSNDATKNAEPSGKDNGIIALTGNKGTGNPKVTYKLDASNPVDLLWGTRSSTTSYNLAGYPSGGSQTDTGGDTKKVNTNLTKQTIGETVDFTFKHTLARIGGSPITINNAEYGGVYVALDIDDNTHSSIDREEDTDGNYLTLVTVNSITIANTTDNDNRANSNIKSRGVFDLCNGTWDVTSAEEMTINDVVNFSSDGTTKGINKDFAEPSSVPTFTSGSEKGWSMKGVTSTLEKL